MLIPLVLALLSTVSAADSAQSDARLHDLCFVDAQHGWAVGDRGVIWNTSDGGRVWRLQPSGVSCPLEGVWFLDEQLGWAVGGFSHPFTHTSTGVILSTADGGKTWTNNPKLVLPALRRVRFFDPQHGWAIGCPSAMYPSGVFVTDDGGRRWRPLPGDAPSGWLSADFLGLRAGALAGRGGSLAAVSGGEIETVRSDQLDLRNMTQLRLLPPSYGWLVGDGGLVRISVNLGATWRAPPTELPPAAKLFDFAALAVRGSHCWLAGTPGTRVFYSADAGRTWNVSSTGSNAPLRAIVFADDQHGWAVGDLGIILVTNDGGQSWRSQRAGGARAALLVLLAEPDDTPLELIASLGGNEGYLAIVDAIGRRDVETASRDDVHINDRLQEAVVRAGGCGAEVAWRFPLRQAGLHVSKLRILEAWDRANEGRGGEELQNYLVRQIRLWRPEVIVTHDAASEEDFPLESLVNKAVLRAVDQAADARGFPEQIDEAGLSPWTVRKVFGAMRGGARGASDLAAAQFAPRLGRTLADAAAEPRSLLEDRYIVAPPTLGFYQLINTAPAGQDRRDFFSGIEIAPGSVSRRDLPAVPAADLNRRQRVAQQRRHAQAILDRAERMAGSVETLLAQIDDLTRDLDDDSRGHILYQLADRYHRTGHWESASEAYTVLSQRFPSHPLTPQAMLWLVQYHASVEAAWRVEHGDGKKRFERAAELCREIERTRPEWFAEPAVCFSLAAAYRGLGQDRLAARLYEVQSHGGSRDAWPICAQAELRLSDPNPKKPTLACIKTVERPHLDGRLDDPVWRQAKSAALQSAQHDDGDWPAAVMLAYDAEFLYIAARCRKASLDGNIAPTSGTPRPRDADLSAHDRIEVFLDMDRDFTVFHRLAIDHRGWTNDSCWGDVAWNPKWFVASQEEPSQWTAEAAIPLAELIGRRPEPRDLWAIGIQRVVPGVGFQSWTTPAAVSVLPDGFGYLAFQ